MRASRREWLMALAGLALARGAGSQAPDGRMLNRRPLGRTGLSVSELGFGGAGIGGVAFGAVTEGEALDALAAAADAGCNFIDTARIYGASEVVLGKHLRSRRSHWIVASKYSGQKAGMRATLEEQLTRLGVEAVDVYQIHWVPKGSEATLYEELYALRKEGKARFVGVSAATRGDVDYVLANTRLDTLQLPFNLLQPEPMIDALPALRRAGLGVIARSVLREGFLTGKFDERQRFDPKKDVRGGLSPEKLAARLEDVEKFRWLQETTGSLANAATRYALSFDGIATALIGTKTAAQARENFTPAARGALSPELLARIAGVQQTLTSG